MIQQETAGILQTAEAFMLPGKKPPITARQDTMMTMICIVEDGDSFLVDDVKYSSKN